MEKLPDHENKERPEWPARGFHPNTEAAFLYVDKTLNLIREDERDFRAWFHLHQMRVASNSVAPPKGLTAYPRLTKCRPISPSATPNI